MCKSGKSSKEHVSGLHPGRRCRRSSKGLVAAPGAAKPLTKMGLSGITTEKNGDFMGNSGFSWGLSGGFMGLSSEQEKRDFNHKD